MINTFLSSSDASVQLFLPPSLSKSEVSRYPLLVNVYGGPESQKVDSSFNIEWGTCLSSMDVVYAMIDGRGSGFKGNKMLFEIYRQFGTVEIEDQIEVTR